MPSRFCDPEEPTTAADRALHDPGTMDRAALANAVNRTVKPGLHENLPASRYHADPSDQPSLSAHIASLLVNSTPLHAWTAHPRLNPDFQRQEKTQFDIGTIVHSLQLEGDDSSVHVIDAADWRKKAAQEERDDARRRGMIPLLEKDWTRVSAMVAAVQTQLEARDDDPPLFTAGKAEQTLIWQEHGITCRSRLDWLRDDFTVIDDWKSTAATANPVQWARRTLWSIGADIQVAFYLRGNRRVNEVDATFRYVIAETSPPYAVSVIAPAPSMLELGQAKVDRAIDRWRECLKSNVWPGYPRAVYYAEPPGYEEMRWLEQDAEAMLA